MNRRRWNPDPRRGNGMTGGFWLRGAAIVRVWSGIGSAHSEHIRVFAFRWSGPSVSLQAMGEPTRGLFVGLQLK